MAKLVKTTIYVGGTEIKQFSELTIQQSIAAHHYFRLIVPADVFEKQGAGPFGSSKNLVGETIKVIISNYENMGKPYHFLGLVTEIATQKFNGYHGDIVISGSSPTLLLDSAPHCKSWERKALKNIVSDVSNVFSGGVLSKVKPKSNETLAYTVQYKETAWQFINRLAANYGEWLYYNGKELVFGESEGESEDLVFGSTLQDFSLSMHLRPGSYSQTAYDYVNSKTYQTSPSGTSDNAGLNSIGSFAQSKSESLFVASPKSYSHQFVTNEKQLQDSVNAKAASQGSNQVKFSGTSSKFGVQIGNNVNIDNNYGSYKIIDVVHRCDGQGNYSNNFIAIPSSIKAPPTVSLGDPFAESQTAVVLDNFDPQHLGRIRVRFHWMNGDERTPWIRLITPHGGSGKGVYFIPEKGEQVMISFENGNPVKPYVSGTVYHNAENAGGLSNNEENDIKAIQTRSGTKIIMNDGIGSIFIEDPSGNTWLMDGKGNISVNAPKNMNITVGENMGISVGKNISLSIGENFTTSVGVNQSTSVGADVSVSAGGSLTETAGKDMLQSAGTDITVTAGNDITQTATGTISELADNKMEIVEENYLRQAKKSVDIAEEIKMLSSKENFEVKSSKTVEINSGEKGNLF
jgi:type VI secretion system secreted protein VgrG